MPFAKTQRPCRMVRRLAPTTFWRKLGPRFCRTSRKCCHPNGSFLLRELEAHVLTVLGESSEEVTQRVSGNAVGMARHGTVNDLALYTLGMNVRVAVIPTSRIFNNTPDEKLVESVVLASVPGECDKSRVICAVLHKNHFNLGVLRTSGSVQAVFQVGKEWDDALQRLLSFIKSRSPPPEPKREDLGPRWVPPTSPSTQKASVSDEKEPSKDGRAIDWDAHARLLNGQQ